MSPGGTNQRVTIVGSSKEEATLLAGLLAAEGFQVEVCNPGELSEEMSRRADAVPLAKVALRVRQVSHFFTTAKTQLPWLQPPLIILASGKDSRLLNSLDLIAEAAGNLMLLERPINPVTLIGSVKIALSSWGRQDRIRDLFDQEQVPARRLR